VEANVKLSTTVGICKTALALANKIFEVVAFCVSRMAMLAVLAALLEISVVALTVAVALALLQFFVGSVLSF
jgi:hypothetical protein